MATGSASSLEDGHDVMHDYCCTPCKGANLNAEALCYCKDCRQLFCEACEKFHERFTSRHTLFGRTELAEWGDIKPAKASYMCDEHPGKELELYCVDHDRLSCSICISVNHR